jgi:hypothetical protein
MIDSCDLCMSDDGDSSTKTVVSLIYAWIYGKPEYKILCEKHLAEELKREQQQQQQEQAKRNDT